MDASRDSISGKGRSMVENFIGSRRNEVRPSKKDRFGSTTANQTNSPAPAIEFARRYWICMRFSNILFSLVASVGAKIVFVTEELRFNADIRSGRRSGRVSGTSHGREVTFGTSYMRPLVDASEFKYSILRTSAQIDTYL